MKIVEVDFVVFFVHSQIFESCLLFKDNLLKSQHDNGIGLRNWG